MDVKPYINPFKEGSGDKVEEPVTVSTSSAHQLDALRHQLMNTLCSSGLCLLSVRHHRISQDEQTAHDQFMFHNLLFYFNAICHKVLANVTAQESCE